MQKQRTTDMSVKYLGCAMRYDTFNSCVFHSSFLGFKNELLQADI